MKISELFGKIAESTTGKRGYVLGVKALASKIVCLVCADEDEREFVVDIKNVNSIADKIIYEDRDQTIKKAREICLGRASFDGEGNFLGNLEEITFSGNKLVKAKIGKKAYAIDELSCGDAIIVRPVAHVRRDVKKGRKTILKKGSALTDGNLQKAIENGAYIQAKLKML